MDTFAKIVPYLNNPLALVGLVLFLVFGVHRVLIRSRIIPPLDTIDASDIVKLILRYGFYLSGAVIVLGFAYAIIQYYTQSAYLTGSVQIINASIADADDEHSFPKLDVSFRNDGKAVAAFKLAGIRIKNVWAATLPYHPSARLVSWIYKTILPVSGSGCTVLVPLNQDVPSNSTDRFEIILGNNASNRDKVYLPNIN
jgi:hypothetical protein